MFKVQSKAEQKINVFEKKKVGANMEVWAQKLNATWITNFININDLHQRTYSIKS